jgi:hypothetical protein
MKSVTLSILMILIIFSLIAMPAGAVTLMNGKFMENVSPGTTIVYPITLVADPSQPPTVYDMSVLGFGNDLAGNYVGIDPSQDTGPYTARPFITLDNTSVTLNPGASVNIQATIHVPASGNGGRYALIKMSPRSATPAGQGSVSISATAVVMITLDGTPITETGTIDNVTIGTVVPEMPTSVTTVFTNTGNHHYYGASNQIVVKDNAGNVVFNSTSPPLNTAIVPGGTVGFTQTISKSLSADTYTLISSVLRSDGTAFDVKTISFSVSEIQTSSSVTSASITQSGSPASSSAAPYSTTPGASVTTSSPVDLPVIGAACIAAICVFGMRKKSE